MSYPTRIGMAFAAAFTIVAPLALLPPAAAESAQASANHGPWAAKPPKVVLISLDGAKPDLIQHYLRTGALPSHEGLGLLIRRGVFARQNITATPSLTAVSHIAIATGSTAAHNDIPANTYHPVAAPITASLSGFGGPIGGYQLSPLGIDPTPTAEPLWVRLRAAGKKVVTATWPGGDGIDVRVNNVVVQAASPTRVVDYTVPFGAFGGLGATGFTLTAANFAPDAAVAAQLAAAGKTSFSPVLATSLSFETFFCASGTTATCGPIASATLNLTFAMRAAALDTTNDGATNYDTLAFFELMQGIQPGPFALPSTGPAYVKVGGESGKFYFEGTGNKVGAAYYVSALAADLSIVRFARYGANFIPRNAPVIADVDDVNGNVGFWPPQPDFRIPERLSPGFTNFPDLELEAMYEDQVETFVRYQSRLAERAIVKNPGADLVMIYIEEPDGSGHQFTLTDRRQASDFRNSNAIGANQDLQKVARYARYLKFAYQQADRAVDQVLDLVGNKSDVFVVSDHGMAPFHTAVSLLNLLRNAGVDTSQLAIRTSGSAVNVYVNLMGRELNGTVGVSAYQALVNQVATVLQNAQDPNPTFNYSLRQKRIFTTVVKRPFLCPEGVGFCTSSFIGQDFGDVLAMLDEGYNFDGIQNPGVARLGDPAFDALTTVFSTPNFYASHGHDPRLPSMSATFIAAGPHIRRGTVQRVSNIDVAPTIMRLLGVRPANTVDGRVLWEILD